MFGRLEAWFVRRPAGTFCGRGRVAALPLHAPFSVLRSPGRQSRPLVLRALRVSPAGHPFHTPPSAPIFVENTRPHGDLQVK